MRAPRVHLGGGGLGMLSGRGTRGAAVEGARKKVDVRVLLQNFCMTPPNVLALSLSHLMLLGF